MYKDFFRIELDHAYFSGSDTVELTIVPDGKTLRSLRGQHLLLKNTKNGLRILMPSNELGEAKASFSPGEVLTFEVYPNSENFQAHTVASGLPENNVWRYSNAGLGAGEVELPPSPAEAKGTLCGYPLVGRVEIEFTPELMASPEERAYKVVFEVKSLKWKYYFVTDKDTSDLNIEDRDERFVFNQQVLDDNSTDKIGTALQTNYPDANVFCFESGNPIPCRDQALKNLQLLRDGDVVVKHLPNPESGDPAVKIIKIHQ